MFGQIVVLIISPGYHIHVSGDKLGIWHYLSQSFASKALHACITYFGKLWLWFKNYLTNRFQFASINISHSHLLPVIYRVSQGSILGPLLFILYMNDLPNAIHWSRTLLFADNTKFFGHIKSPDDEQSLQNNLYNLAFWSAIHLMYFSMPPKVPMYRLINNFYII